MMFLNSNISAFLAVVENVTVSAAAKALGITQTGATQRIKALEKHVGGSLFLRSRSGMRLTPEGTALLRHCLQVRELEDRMVSELRQSGLDHEVDLALAGPSGVIARRIIPQCTPLFEKWPKLNLKFISAPYSDRLRLLKTGAADLVILMTYDVRNEVDSKIIDPNEMMLVATNRWRHRTLEDVLQSERLIAYHEDDGLGTDYLKEFGLLNLVKRPPILANDNEMMMSLVRQGLGFALVPKELASPLIEKEVLIALNDGKSMTIPFALVWFPRSEMPMYFKEIIQAIK